jgi:hypothetical protein
MRMFGMLAESLALVVVRMFEIPTTLLRLVVMKTL